MSNEKQVPPASVLVDGVNYTAVATAVPSTTSSAGARLDRPTHTVSDEFASMPEARNLQWEDDFFDDEDDIVAVFDFDYEAMESYYTSVGWVCIGATILYTPLFMAAMVGLAPCFLRRNVQWNVQSQHVAVTRDGIRFVRERRPTCWGMPCTDAGKSSKTVPFDKITDCDIEEPAGNTCICVKNVLSTVNIDTASSGTNGQKEIQIRGLVDPHAFKKLVWAMKRAGTGAHAAAAATMPTALEMADRKGNGNNVSSLLMEIRDELRQHNTLLQSMREQSPSAPAPSAPTDNEIV